MDPSEIFRMVILCTVSLSWPYVLPSWCAARVAMDCHGWQTVGYGVSSFQIMYESEIPFAPINIF